MNAPIPAGLSERTWSVLGLIFPREQHQEVARLLIEECGNNLPFLQELDAVGLERFRFAALKLSQGQVDQLLEAVILAQTDWRDLLVSAGFANSTTEHRAWARALMSQSD